MRLLIGVSGGVAAYKAIETARLAVRAGHSVRVIQTPTSQQRLSSSTSPEPASAMSTAQGEQWADRVFGWMQCQISSTWSLTALPPCRPSSRAATGGVVKAGLHICTTMQPHVCIS